MGDPKKLRKKYATPIHPWNEKRINEEKELVKEFGLKKKKEIMIADSFLKKYMNIAKKLIAKQTVQGEKEKAQVLDKLQRLGLLTAGAELDHVLSLHLKDVLERRLQSIIFRRGLARSMNQARQFIVHRHILVGGKEVTAPSYLVSLEEEANITFKEKSALSSEDHPERADPKAAVKEEIKKVENAEEEPVVEEKKEESTGEVKEEKAEPAKEEPKVEEKPAEEAKEEEEKKE